MGKMMLYHCPGAANLRTPPLSFRKCPQCGEEGELFSRDISVKCSGAALWSTLISNHASRGADKQRNVLVRKCSGNVRNEKVLPLIKQEK